MEEAGGSVEGGKGCKDYLRQAVELKSAMLKANPGRREWEAAPDFMKGTAARVVPVQNAREGSFDLQHTTALHFKEKGNKLIAEDPESALQHYVWAISVWLWFDRGPNNDAEDIPLRCGLASVVETEGEEAEGEARHLLAQCFSNAASCLLKLARPEDALYACDKALEFDPYCVKALYRRAQAQRQSGTTAGLEGAVSDLQEALQLEPGSTAVRTALQATQNELYELRRHERAMYGNMFSKAAQGENGGEQPSRTSHTASQLVTSSQRQNPPQQQQQPVNPPPQQVAPTGMRVHSRRRGSGRSKSGDGGLNEGDTDDEDETDDDDDDWSELDDLPERDAEGRWRDARESERLFQAMRRNVARAKQRTEQARLQKAGILSPPPSTRNTTSGTTSAAASSRSSSLRGGRGGIGGGGGGGGFLSAVFGPVMRLPWWALLLILAHMSYRMVKLWTVPLRTAPLHPSFGANTISSDHGITPHHYPSAQPPSEQPTSITFSSEHTTMHLRPLSTDASSINPEVSGDDDGSKTKVINGGDNHADVIMASNNEDPLSLIRQLERLIQDDELQEEEADNFGKQQLEGQQMQQEEGDKRQWQEAEEKQQQLEEQHLEQQAGQQHGQQCQQQQQEQQQQGQCVQQQA